MRYKQNYKEICRYTLYFRDYMILVSVAKASNRPTCTCTSSIGKSATSKQTFLRLVLEQVLFTLVFSTSTYLTSICWGTVLYTVHPFSLEYHSRIMCLVNKIPHFSAARVPKFRALLALDSRREFWVKSHFSGTSGNSEKRAGNAR